MSILFLSGDYTTKLLHVAKLETVLHKLFGEIFDRVCRNDLESFEIFRVYVTSL